MNNSTHKCFLCAIVRISVFRGAWVRTSVFEIRQIRTGVSRCV